MWVYRICKMKERTRDLSGTGASLYGGRWNSEGTFMLYTSLSPALSMLEMLAHADEFDVPPQMYLSKIRVSDESPIYEFPEAELPFDWRESNNFELKKIGDQLMAKKEYLGIKVLSAVFSVEWNLLLNPLFPGYTDLVRVESIQSLDTDSRLL